MRKRTLSLEALERRDLPSALIAGVTAQGPTLTITHSDGTAAQLAPFPEYGGPVKATWNNDTNRLVLVATGPGGSATKVYTSGTLHELASFIAFPGFQGTTVAVALGDAFSPTGDEDGDGITDVAVTAEGPGSGLATKVFDGASFTVVASVVPYPGYGGYGQVLASYGASLELTVALGGGLVHYVEYQITTAGPVLVTSVIERPDQIV